jgi:small-conductance mechanosensitive channel
MDQFFAFYGQYQNTINFLIALVGTVAFSRLIIFIFDVALGGVTKKTKTELDDDLMVVSRRPIYWGILVAGFYMAFRQLPILADYQKTMLLVTKLFVALLFIALFVGISDTMFTWLNRNEKVDRKQKGFLHTIRKLVNALIYFMGLVFVLKLFGLEVSPLIASLGIGGLAIGLALQPTLSNYFSGLYVASDGFVKIGDYIELSDTLKGYVEKIGWRNTIIRMWNNNLVMIPNSKMAESNIINYDEPQNKMSFILFCGVAYDTDLKKAEKIALEVAQKMQKRKKFGMEDYTPVVRFYEFADSNINFKLIMQAKNRLSHYEMMHESMKALKASFDKAKITISFPMRTVEFNQPELFVKK